MIVSAVSPDTAFRLGYATGGEDSEKITCLAAACLEQAHCKATADIIFARLARLRVR